MQVLQGNVLLTPVRGIPNEARDVTEQYRSNRGSIVLSRGETGGEHEFRNELVRVWQDGAEVFIEVLGDEPVVLEHTTPRHDWMRVDPGTYRFSNQRAAPPPRTEQYTPPPPARD